MKVAMVTGSSKGIGRAIAKKLNKEGFDVVITYFQDQVAGDKVFKEINKKGLLVKLDSGNEDSVKAAVKDFSKKYDHLDVLVISGMEDRPKGFLKTSLADWNYVINNKLTGTFLVAQNFYPFLKKSQKATIILNTSSVDERPVIGAIAYSAASGGVTNLMKSLALELAPLGIRVNAIAPGTTRTDNWKGFGLEDDEMWKRFARENPMKRVCTPEDLGDLVSYLISDEAKYINGNIIYADGGNRHR